LECPLIIDLDIKEDSMVAVTMAVDSTEAVIMAVDTMAVDLI
jgi:hypothetical protein